MHHGPFHFHLIFVIPIPPPRSENTAFTILFKRYPPSFEVGHQTGLICLFFFSLPNYESVALRSTSMRTTMVLLSYIHGCVLDADGKGEVTRRQSMVTELGDACRRGMTGLNTREGKEDGRKKLSMRDGFCPLLEWNAWSLLLRLASFGATPWPLSGLGGWGGLGFPCGCHIFRYIGRTRRCHPAIDSGVRAFVSGDFGNVLIARELLV